MLRFTHLFKVWSMLGTRSSCLKTLQGHEDSVTTLSMEGNKIISGSLDRTIKVSSFLYLMKSVYLPDLTTT